MDKTAHNRRGILAMLTAMTLFTGNDTLVKLASATYPPGEIMAVRGAFAVLTALGLTAAIGELRHLRGLASPMVLVRAAFEAGVAFLFITSLGHLPLANITAILQATPIILTLMAVLLGLERVGWRRWGAILVGFVGVLLVVRPSPAGFNVFAGLACAAAVAVAGRDLVTRFIGGHVPSAVVTLATTAAVTIAGLLLGLAEEWRPLAVPQMLLLAAAAVFVTLGNLAVVVALRSADISVVSPFRYSVIVVAIVIGFLVFGELPDPIASAGIALIALSGLYTIHRQSARSRGTTQPLA